MILGVKWTLSRVPGKPGREFWGQRTPEALKSLLKDPAHVRKLHLPAGETLAGVRCGIFTFGKAFVHSAELFYIREQGSGSNRLSRLGGARDVGRTDLNGVRQSFFTFGSR